MRNFFYALIFSSIIIFGSLSVLKSNAEDNNPYQISPSNFPYQIIEINPFGEEIVTIGQTDQIDPIKIIPQLGIAYYPEDKILAFPNPDFGIGSKITINRAPVITIKDGKKVKEYRSWKLTVGELLSEKSIEIGADDKIDVDLSAEIFDGSKITITRVAITTVVETKAIDFQIQEKEDPNLDYGKKRVEVGEKGEKKLTYRVVREDGEEVSRTLLNSEITKQPATQINYIGTKVTVLSSVRGRATMTPFSGYVVSGIKNYPKGTLIRISANGVSIIVKVSHTWGTASPPEGVILDLAPSFLSQLRCPKHGCSSVLVEEIKQ